MGSRDGAGGLLKARQRRLAWVGFVLLAAYAPVMAWLKRDDSWLMPLAVAGMVGYALIVDDHLRRRATRRDGAAAGATGAGADTTRGRPVDSPGPDVSVDAPMSGASLSDASISEATIRDASMSDQRPDR